MSWFATPVFCFLCLASSLLPATRGLVTDISEFGILAPLDLDDFEDDDCLEATGADVLLHLLHELADVLDQVLHGGEDGKPAWDIFDDWQGDGRMEAMTRLAPVVLGRAYCEPGKLSWLATQCLLVLRESSPSEALQCATSLDEDLLEQMTPRGQKFTTRLHLVLRSPWPAFRLLDLLVRLHPESGSTRMGACRKNMKWNSDPDVFDWPTFKPTVIAAVNGLAADEVRWFHLSPEDGPLSRQYRARWLRIHNFPPMKEAISFSDDVFDAYREHHYRAGCHLGVIASYALQVLLVNLRDVEGRMQRYCASVANLVNIHAPFHQTAKTDWPLFRLLHFVSLLQRAEPWTVWKGMSEDEPSAGQDAARRLVADVEKAVLAKASASASAEVPMAFLTSAWGWQADHLGHVLDRWTALFAEAPLVVLARDSHAIAQCEQSASSKRALKALRCVDSPMRLGVESMVAKYLSLAALTRLGLTAVWLDLDVFVAAKPFDLIRRELARPEQPDLVFARHLMSESVSPAVVVARGGSASAVSLLLGYARWLRENPFLLDHQGWDQYLDNRPGDFAGGFDYKGRNVTVKDDEGPQNSFLPRSGVAPPGSRHATFKEGFGSGDGWLGKSTAEDVVLFHFWGAKESQADMFELFYPSLELGVKDPALEVLKRYRRRPTSGPSLSALSSSKGGPGSKEQAIHLVEISYAHGCCAKSLKRNQQQALKVGATEARAYGYADLGPDWAARHELILSQKRGAGWWLWKPHLILRTLKDPALPWNRGVVLWVDAGNYLHADPRPMLSKALQASDVTALRLKWCLEVDWTSSLTLRHLNMSARYPLVDRPQLGAYFLAFRKTEASIAFVEEWLRLAQDPVALLGLASAKLDLGQELNSSLKQLMASQAGRLEIPSFQTHQADQSIFSLLFKEWGFRAVSLEEGHKVVTLDRWRE